MAAIADDIRRWLKKGKEEGATHVIVICDTYDYSDFPVMVMPEQDAKKEADAQAKKNMQIVMEVYDLSLDWEEQLRSGTKVLNHK